MKFIIVSLFLVVSSASYANTCLSEEPSLKGASLIGYLSLEQDQEKSKELDWGWGNDNSIIRPSGKHLELLNTKIENGRDLVVVLWESNKKIRYLLTTPLKRSSKKYGGISTHDRIDINWTTGNKEWPDIYLTQTSVPSKKDEHFMPGPPMYFRYQYQIDTACYLFSPEKNQE